jgi:uncharacterized repeat protein (TIGR01451 family)
MLSLHTLPPSCCLGNCSLHSSTSSSHGLVPGKHRFKYGIPLLAVIAFTLGGPYVHAAGTPAGTLITNTATLSYSIGGIPEAPIASAPASLQVAEIINLTLVWQDGAPVSVASPDTNDALTFLLTNTGNGVERFTLTRNNLLAGDNYDPLNGSAGAIFLESGLAPGLQTSGPTADTLYVAGVNDPDLPADVSRTVYVVSNTPAGLVSGNAGLATLAAAATTPGAAGAAPGTTLAGLGTGGVDAVVGASQAQASRTGSYLVSDVALSVVKTVVSVLDPRGGSNVEAGSVLTYRITVTLSGTGGVNNLIITDPLPAQTTYVAGSMLVNGATRTDAVDADNARFSANTVTVDFGNTASPVVHVIDFRATVN